MSANGINTASDADAMRTWSSIGGCDIVAVINGTECGTIQAISCSVTREKMPNYVMGRADPVGFSRGKRGIAGSMVGVVFNQSWLVHTLKGNSIQDKNNGLTFMAGHREYRQLIRLIGGRKIDRSEDNDTLRRIEAGNQSAVSFYTGRSRQQAWYVDQILPFNIVITGVNEYGGGIAKSIVGVEIMNEATGVSVDDVMIDESHTYIALAMTPWMGLQYVNPRTGERGDQDVSSIISSQGLDQAGAIFNGA